MRVLIEADVFERLTDEKLAGLNYLLCVAAYNERHSLYVNECPKEWRDRLGEYERSTIVQATVNAINNPVVDCTIAERGIGEDSNLVFTVDEAIYFLSQPISIILENNRNDGIFIDTLIECYNNQKLLNARQKHWLVYTNAGGCSNVRNLVDALLGSHDNRKKFLRCFVILDSDKFFPTHANPNAKVNIEYLIEKDIPFHVWEKRAMENYLPDNALPEGPWRDAYTHLSKQQQDYYCVAGGFDKDEKFVGGKDKPHDRSSLLPEQNSFYSDVSEENYRILYAGLKLSNFKHDFPALFTNRDVVNYDSLQEKISHQTDKNELKGLLDQIERML